MKTAQLPPAYQRRFARTVALVEGKKVQPANLGGKVLHRFPDILSVPLGRRYRILFRRSPAGFRLHGCFTHETYNRLVTGRSLQ